MAWWRDARFGMFLNALPSLRNTLGPGASVEQGIELFLALNGWSGVGLERTRYMLRSEVELYYAGSAADQSLDWFWEDAAFGGAEAFAQGGCSQMVQHLAAGLDVRLNTPVQGIDHTAYGAEVHTAGESFRCSHVVVTVSLGVLKSGAIQFNPPLPAAKTARVALTRSRAWRRAGPNCWRRWAARGILSY